MSDIAKRQHLQKVCQPGKDDLTKGYRVKQQVDLNNLKIPKNMRDAAVAPPNGGNTVPTPVAEGKKD